MRSIRAIENSDVCILMLDATRGIESQDMNIFQLIQKNQKSLVVVVNKWDLAEDKSQKRHHLFRGYYPRTFRPLQGFPHHLCLGTDQTAHFPRARDGQAGVSEP